MKKLLSLVLVLAVVLSSMSFVFAAAPSDLGDYKYADSVKKLVGLGIINGYPDGTFKPTGNITRAEFAKVVVTALGYSDAAVAAGDAKFSDMTGHWAVGYVNVASSLGVINGVGAGKFAPDANVKYEEAVTMIVRALGYEPAAKSNGGYPNGYLTIASQKKITKDIAMVAGTVADRGTVAKLMAESLEVPFLKQTGYGTLTTYEEAKTPAGVVTESLMLTGLKLDDYTVTVDSYDTTKKTVSFTGYVVDGKKTVSYVDPIDPVGTENCEVKVWYKDSTIFAFENKTDVKVGRIDEVNGTDDSVDTDVALDNATAVEKVKLQGGAAIDAKDTDEDADADDFNATVKVNDEDYDSSAAVAKIGDLIGMYAKAYVNKDSGEMFRLEAFDLANPGIITTASATEIKYQKYDDNDVYLSNIDDADDMLLVFVDGVQKTISDLKADMYFESWVNDDGGKIVIAASTAKVTGKLTTYTNDTTKIAGTAYDTVGDNTSGGTNYISYNDGKDYDKDTLSDVVGLDVVAYKNFDDKLAFLKGKATSTTTDFYALVKSWAQEGKSITVMKDVDGKSTEVTYSVKTDSDELKASGDATNISWNEFLGNMALLSNSENAGETITSDDAADTDYRIYKFFVNSDNKITEIQDLGWTNPVEVALDFEKDDDFIDFNTGSATVGTTKFYVDGTKFFDLTNNEVRYWTKIEGNENASISLAIVEDSNNTDAEVVAFLGGTYSFVESTDNFYAYIKSYEVDNDYYTFTTSAGTTLKLDKDDLAGNATAEGYQKDADKYSITYIKDGDNIKVKSITKAVYNNAEGVTATILYDTNTNNSADTTVDVDYVSGTKVDVDGNNITIDATGRDGNAAYSAAGQTFKLASDCVVIRTTFKSNGEVDSATVSNKTSIADGEELVLVIVDGLVRAVYYKH